MPWCGGVKPRTCRARSRLCTRHKVESRCEVRPVLSPSKRLNHLSSVRHLVWRERGGFGGDEEGKREREREIDTSLVRRARFKDAQWVPRRSRNATRRDGWDERGGGVEGAARGRKGALDRAVCAAERQLQLRSRDSLDRRGTSLHGMCFLRPLSLSFYPFIYLPLAFCYSPSHVPVHVLLPFVFLSLLLMLSSFSVFREFAECIASETAKIKLELLIIYESLRK